MFFFREKGIESKKQHIFFVKENNNNRHLYFTKFSFQEKSQHLSRKKISQVYQRYDALQRMGSLGDDGVGENRTKNMLGKSNQSALAALK